MKNNDFDYDKQPELLKNCYSEDILSKLNLIKKIYIQNYDNSAESEIIWLAITAILRCTSHAGTAQWQYVLPNKSKKNAIDPQFALKQKLEEIINDLYIFNSKNINSKGIVLDYDARNMETTYKDKFDILITSPPYPNNYDYADSTRLELMFWGEINRWADLQKKIRNGLVRSCSQHSAAQKLQLGELLDSSLLNLIKEEIKDVCQKLEIIRLEHGGKKTYHTMIAAYWLFRL
jgi:hypothetical protein